MLKKRTRYLLKFMSWLKLGLIVIFLILVFTMCVLRDRSYDPNPYRGYDNYWHYIR